MPTAEKTDGVEVTRWSPWADLSRWNPWSDLVDWNNRFGQFLEHRWPHHLALGADLEEAEDAYLLEFDVPGVAKSDVSVEVTGRRVCVHGTRAEKERAGVLRHSTRAAGEFVYEVSLPSPVDDKHVSATLEGGVLSLRIPKAGDAKTTHVEIG